MTQKIAIQNIYPLTPLQEGILFHYLMDKGTKSYIEQMVLTVKGDLDKSVMKEAFQLIFDRHDVLRTVFRSEKLAKPLQVVLKSRKAQIHYEDVSGVILEGKDSVLDNYRSIEIEKGFDLSKEQLFRMTVLKIADQKYKLILTFHHIILDGWSVSVLLEELLNTYRAFSEGENINFEGAFPFSSYISWMNKQNTDEAASYWNNYFLHYEKPLRLPELSNKKVSPDYRAEEFVFDLGKGVTESLREIAKDEKVTLNSVVQSLWGLLLHWYSQSDDIVFGSVVSGRSPELPGIEKAVGMYINTVPVRMKIDKDISFTSLVQTVHEDGLRSKPYEFYPLYSIERKLNHDQDLINHVLAFENYPLDPKKFESSKDNHFSVENVKFYDQTHYDLNIVVFPEESLTFRISFNSEVYDKEFVKGIKSHLSQLAEHVCEHPDRLLGDLSPIADEERDFILKNGKGKIASYPSEATIHEIFEMCAERYPSKGALKFGEKEYTYSEVNREANRIAAFLRKNGLKRGEIAAILANRTPETVIGILAILKAGGTYLPIDPALPEDRILYTLNDSRAGFLLDQTNNFKGYAGIVINLRDSQLKKMPAENLLNVNEPSDSAYVIYTSGTTGKPKGVMVEHQNVVRLLHTSSFQFTIGSEDIWTIFHSFSFDFSVWEMFGALLHGGKGVIVPKETAQDPKEFSHLIQIENVTILNQTPSAFSRLIDEINSHEKENISLRYVIFGGEALKPAMLQEWNKKYPEVKVVNMYGITETTVHVTYKEITANDITQNISNIGKPIPTNHVYILNEQKKLLPAGVIGELYVGGKGVTKGYLFREELTKERFVDNPFIDGERMYKTGDLARMLPNGELEYLGRIDHQIKVRGHRIEMGEIENRLLFHPSIKEAAVLATRI
ncbi:non-ribosomal peptide synthetase [Lysinibacillus sphaericus]